MPEQWLRTLRSGWCLLLLCCIHPLGAQSAPLQWPRDMRHFKLLERALLQYQQLAAQPSLTTLPPLPARTLRAGQEYQGIEALGRLLSATGDLPHSYTSADGGLPVLDATLVAALMRFQERHGLVQDGVLGPATWRALTTPMTTRLRQIQRTLARWRSLPANPYSRAIFINIPRFRLYGMRGFDDSEPELLQMDVVVGKAIERLRTPTFSADLTHLIFRPYWDVPPSIARSEILPAARRDREYLASSNFELVDAGGKVMAQSPASLDALARGEIRVRQRPGDHNALGAVKFVLPNSHNVYLHDTPDHRLFAQPARAFSHGCIRVAEPAKLAQWLLAEDPKWTADRVTDAMQGSDPLRVNLAEPVRVYIVYGTAIAREDGTVLFLDDLYGIDRN